jgi:hypothetical protein
MAKGGSTPHCHQISYTQDTKDMDVLEFTKVTTIQQFDVGLASASGSGVTSVADSVSGSGSAIGLSPFIDSSAKTTPESGVVESSVTGLRNCEGSDTGNCWSIDGTGTSKVQQVAMQEPYTLQPSLFDNAPGALNGLGWIPNS